MGTKEWIIRSVKAFFITLMLYLLVLLILYFVFYEKIIFPTSQSAAQTMTLNLENFETSSSAQSEESLQETPETSVEEPTNSFVEKIVHDHDSPDAIPVETNEESLEEITKKLLEKIANSQKKPVKEVQKKENPVEKVLIEKILPNTNTEQKKQKILKARLEKETQEKLIKEENEKKIAQETAKLAKLEQERLAKLKTEEERLTKIKAEKLKKELEKHIKEEQENINKEIARLVKLEKKRLAQQEAKKRKLEHLKKIAEKKRKEKLRKKRERLAQKKLHKAKLEKKKKMQKKLAERKAKNKLSHSIIKTSRPFSERKSSSASMKMIKQFYGSEFNSFTGTQKSFIEKNLGNIYQITQRTLSRNGYPEVAARTQQQGTQLVTFYLHPNGAISGLHYKQRLGFASLDNNTMKIIKIAYKNYPRPKTTTKITFYVQYSLF